MATYYVGKNGNDSWNGTAPAFVSGSIGPKLTIDAGIGLLASGDTLFVQVGTYTTFSETAPIPSGTSWTNMTIISNFGSDIVTLTGRLILSNSGPKSYVNINGFIIDGQFNNEAVWCGNSDHIKLSNNEIKNAGTHGVAPGPYGWVIGNKIHHGGTTAWEPRLFYNNAIYTGVPATIEHNEIYDFAGACIQIYSGTGTGTDGTIVRYNFCHNTSGSLNALGDGQGAAQGIILFDGTGLQAYNNVISNLQGNSAEGGAVGIMVRAHNVLVYNNTIYNSPLTAIQILSGSTSVQVKNNIMWLNAFNYIENLAGSETVQSNNLTSNPNFVDPNNNNLRLLLGSPAINMGANLSPTVVDDFDGVSRPQGSAYDIGAFEFVTSGTTFFKTLAATTVSALTLTRKKTTIKTMAAVAINVATLTKVYTSFPLTFIAGVYNVTIQAAQAIFQRQ